MASTTAQTGAPFHNFYKVLSVKKDSNEATIRDAYKVEVIKAHPDKPGGSAEKFKLVQTAYETLKNPSARRQHNQKLADAQKLRAFRGTRPVALDSVKNPVQFKLMDGTVYDFETAPDRFRSRFRHGDVVQGPCGSVGVIVGMASNGVYWCKNDSGVANLLFSQGMGGDKDIKLIFKSPPVQSAAPSSGLGSPSGSFRRGSTASTNTPTTPGTPSGRRTTTQAAAAGSPRPGAAGYGSQSSASKATRGGMGDTTTSATTPDRASTRASTRASQAEAAASATFWNKASPGSKTPRSGASSSASKAPRSGPGSQVSHDRQALRRYEGLIRRLVLEEAQQRKQIVTATEDYFTAFHDSLIEWVESVRHKGPDAGVRASDLAGVPGTPRRASGHMTPRKSVPLRRTYSSVRVDLQSSTSTSTTPSKSSGLRTPRGGATRTPKPDVFSKSSSSTECGISEESATSASQATSNTPSRESKCPSEVVVNTSSKRYSAAVPTPRGGVAGSSPCSVGATPERFPSSNSSTIQRGRGEEDERTPIKAHRDPAMSLDFSSLAANEGITKTNTNNNGGGEDRAAAERQEKLHAMLQKTQEMKKELYRSNKVQFNSPNSNSATSPSTPPPAPLSPPLTSAAAPSVRIPKLPIPQRI